MVGGLVTHQFEGVTAFQQGLTLRDQAFEFDGFDLTAVLLTLPPALRLLIVVKFALDPIGGPVEDIDRRPEQVVEIGFEAGVLQRRNQGVENIGNGTGNAVPFGQRPWVGFVLEGAIAVKLKFLEQMVGWG